MRHKLLLGKRSATLAPGPCMYPCTSPTPAIKLHGQVALESGWVFQPIDGTPVMVAHTRQMPIIKEKWHSYMTIRRHYSTSRDQNTIQNGLDEDMI